MIAIRTILSPVNFSPATARQVGVAAGLCEKFNARLVLHHNLSAVAIGAGVGWMWAADHPAMSEETVQRRLYELAQSCTEIETETRITQGPSSVAVLAVSEAVGADLIVLSTHNTSPEDHASVAEVVLESGERSVLALHDSTDDERVFHFDPSSERRQVTLVPTDLTRDSRIAVDFAFELARTLPLEIHLLHLVSHRHSVIDAERQLRALVPADSSTYSSVHARPGDAVEGILQSAKDLSAACVIMGEHTREPLRRWLSRDTSQAVLHKAPCPVWYVPRPRAA
jgi:nucleotide-binding universal stress UspA family protein